MSSGRSGYCTPGALPRRGGEKGRGVYSVIHSSRPGEAINAMIGRDLRLERGVARGRKLEMQIGEIGKASLSFASG